VWSVTKSFISALFGQMIDQGLLKDEFIPIDEFFPQLTDETKKLITVSQLLTMTSGIQDDLSYMYSPTPSSYILDFELDFSPGTWWAYTSAGTHSITG
jgi:CubicO group peptidase (beta-lactamase class C family)